MKTAKKNIQIYLDNAQSQPKISIVIDGVLDENLPTDSVLTSLYRKTDGIFLMGISVVPYKEGYELVRTLKEKK